MTDEYTKRGNEIMAENRLYILSKFNKEVMDELFDVTISAAKGGDSRALSKLWELSCGKPSSSIEITSGESTGVDRYTLPTGLDQMLREAQKRIADSMSMMTVSNERPTERGITTAMLPQGTNLENDNE